MQRDLRFGGSHASKF